MNTIAIPVQSAPAIPAPRHESEAAALLSMLERVARDETVSLERMERLLEMHAQVRTEDARRQFDAAFAAMQSEIPVTIKRGVIDIGRGKPQPYARWEDISDDIGPVLTRHGFGLSFRCSCDAGKVTVTAVLAHCAGHREENTLALPVDTSGSKNAVQAIGSSTSYGRRYTAGMLLNLTSRGEDDDGHRGGGSPLPELISDEQLADLAEVVREHRIDKERFCKFLGVRSLAELPADRASEAFAAAKMKAPK